MWNMFSRKDIVNRIERLNAEVIGYNSSLETVSNTFPRPNNEHNNSKIIVAYSLWVRGRSDFWRLDIRVSQDKILKAYGYITDPARQRSKIMSPKELFERYAEILEEEGIIEESITEAKVNAKEYAIKRALMRGSSDVELTIQDFRTTIIDYDEPIKDVMAAVGATIQITPESLGSGSFFRGAVQAMYDDGLLETKPDFVKILSGMGSYVKDNNKQLILMLIYDERRKKMLAPGIVRIAHGSNIVGIKSYKTFDEAIRYYDSDRVNEAKADPEELMVYRLMTKGKAKAIPFTWNLRNSLRELFIDNYVDIDIDSSVGRDSSFFYSRIAPTEDYLVCGLASGLDDCNARVVIIIMHDGEDGFYTVNTVELHERNTKKSAIFYPSPKAALKAFMDGDYLLAD